jgi:hypothetical protein
MGFATLEVAWPMFVHDGTNSAVSGRYEKSACCAWGKSKAAGMRRERCDVGTLLESIRIEGFWESVK